MHKIKLLIVDDHTIVREGLRSLLELAGDMEIAGEASNGREGLEQVEKIHPNVVLIDIAMPIMGGLEAIRRIRKKFPEIKILVLTQYDDKEHVFPAIQAGANGFISKAAASSELTAGIRAVFSGGSYLSPSIAKLFVEDYKHEAAARVRCDPYEQLTDRERDVLILVAEGHTTQEIADTLVISPKTVEGHKRNLMVKLDITNRIDLVKYAVRRGLIDV